MRHVLLCICACLMLFYYSTDAKRGKNKAEFYSGPARTEQELISRLITVMQFEDSTSHSNMFMPFDTLWKAIATYRDTSVDANAAVAQIRNNALMLRRFDPFFNPNIGKDFKWVIRKGEDSEVHWKNIVMVRYHLTKTLLTRDMIGYDKIAVNRLEGYIFFKDMLTREIYGVAVKDIQQIKGFWYGGHIVDIFNAATEDEYVEKMKDEAHWYKEMVTNGVDMDSFFRVTDSILQASRVVYFDSSEIKHRRDIVDRKMYTGLFDNEIPITLYIQYLKGMCKEPVCSYAAILKFGDRDEYIKLSVTRTPEGKWIFLEEPDVSNMELTLTGKVFTGTWISSKDRVEYEMRLKEKLAGKNRVQYLDDELDYLYFRKKENKD